jgi:hypothetical protein
MTLLPLQVVCMEKHQAAFSQPNVTVRIIKSIWPSNNSDRVRPGHGVKRLIFCPQLTRSS